MTKRAIWIEEPTATPSERSILSWTETDTAVTCSAALPTIGSCARRDSESASTARAVGRGTKAHEDQGDPFGRDFGMRFGETVDRADEELGGDYGKDTCEYCTIGGSSGGIGGDEQATSTVTTTSRIKADQIFN